MNLSLLTSAATIVDKRALKPPRSGRTAETELLLLPSGEILVHNLTPAMARLLVKIDPALGVRLGMTMTGTKKHKTGRYA